MSTIYFLDEFSGVVNTNIVDHSPNINFPVARTWVDIVDLTLDGKGRLRSGSTTPDTFVSCNFGNATNVSAPGLADTIDGTSTGIQAHLTFITPALVQSPGLDYLLVGVGLRFGTMTCAVKLYMPNAGAVGDISVRCSANGAADTSLSLTGFAPGRAYSLSLVVRSTMEVLAWIPGKMATPLTNTATTGTTTLGLNKLSVSLGGSSFNDPGGVFIDQLFVGEPTHTGDAVAQAPSAMLTAGVVGAATATATLTSPSPTISATGFGGLPVLLTAPTPTLSSFGGGQTSLVNLSPTLLFTARDSTGERAASLTAPSPTLSTFGGANSALNAPSPTLSTTGTVVQLAAAALTAPLPTLVTAGTVSGTSNAALRAPIATLVGYSGAVCSVTLTGPPTLAATGTTGSVGGAQVTCPLFELTASATAQAHGSANLIAPSPRMGQTAQAWLTAPGAQLTAIGHAVVTATYEAYATNLKHNPKPGVEPHDEVTRYTNFPFTHVVRYQNSYYGANSTGLYLLDGTVDDAVPIPWNWKTATTDFKSPQNKTVASAYFGGRLGPADTITLHAGEGAKVQAYSYTTPRGALAQNYRQAFGKGIKSHRYYAIEASGTGELALDDISLDVHNLSRRI